MSRSRDVFFQHTRSELCGGVRELLDQKKFLRESTFQQRERLQALDHEVTTLRAKLAEEDLMQADVECVNWSRKCAADAALLELDGAKTEKTRLERELASFKNGAAQIRSSREADAQRGLERSTWRAECADLEKELALAHSHLSELEDARTLAQSSSDLVHRQAETVALREDFSVQRRLRSEAEWAWRVAQQDLAALREQRRKTGAETGRLEIERARLTDLRSKLSRETETRKQQTAELHSALADLDALREELQATISANAQLRLGVEKSLHGLEQIQKHSSEANANSRFDPEERRRAASWGRAM
mmetsp:Transcript_72650/g.113679  ORF Transcript_72650/g.113679 Transcript_72650/m.113679 type:complete len:305 (-) Transcript_72650:9-923(-)